MATYPHPPEDQFDITDHMKASPSNDHVHPVNKGEHLGNARRSQFDPEGVEVPARPSRERVNPAIANALRRTPLIDTTAITSGHGNSHHAEPVPERL
jgi:hypothetical protein